MTRWSARRSSALPSDRRYRTAVIRRVASAAALLAVALWLGGLLALGAIAAPVVFARVALPASADAMTVVFRRFDVVAMGSAVVVLGAEAAMWLASAPFAALDRWRVAVGALAGAIAAFEATAVSPRIAAVHAAGFVRGVAGGGLELARLHDVAESCGKAEAALLVAVIVLHVLALSSPAATGTDARAPGSRAPQRPGAS
jgi:Domain of unknown function (DUF4149)